MILICYDGSDDALAAIDRAALTMTGAEATVLTLWEPFLDTMSRTSATGLGLVATGVFADDREIDARRRRDATELAAEGSQRAVAANLRAEPRIAAKHGGSARSILAVADDIDAAIIVLGTRGRGGLRSFLLGSVSHEVIQHADRPVLVVPSAELAEQRREWANHGAISAVVI